MIRIKELKNQFVLLRNGEVCYVNEDFILSLSGLNIKTKYYDFDLRCTLNRKDASEFDIIRAFSNSREHKIVLCDENEIWTREDSYEKINIYNKDILENIKKLKLAYPKYNYLTKIEDTLYLLSDFPKSVSRDFRYGIQRELAITIDNDLLYSSVLEDMEPINMDNYIEYAAHKLYEYNYETTVYDKNNMENKIIRSRNGSFGISRNNIIYFTSGINIELNNYSEELYHKKSGDLYKHANYDIMEIWGDIETVKDYSISILTTDILKKNCTLLFTREEVIKNENA